MTPQHIAALLLRDLRAVRRQVEAFPDDAAPWRDVPGIPNTSGTLALHLAGNIQHFVGAVLGRSGYVRDRDAEFARRNVPRAELLAGLDAAMRAVEATLGALAPSTLEEPWPEPIAGRRVRTDTFLLHLATHLGYHLGQMDYHRRVVTGVASGLDAVSVRELPELA